MAGRGAGRSGWCSPFRRHPRPYSPWWALTPGRFLPLPIWAWGLTPAPAVNGVAGNRAWPYCRVFWSSAVPCTTGNYRVHLRPLLAARASRPIWLGAPSPCGRWYKPPASVAGLFRPMQGRTGDNGCGHSAVLSRACTGIAISFRSWKVSLIWSFKSCIRLPLACVPAIPSTCWPGLRGALACRLWMLVCGL